MNVNDKISLHYQDYKAYQEDAMAAERRGNLEGARKLYRQAALALCEMAKLESGNTQLQRIEHAQEVMDYADSLLTARAQPAGSSGSGSAGQSAKQAGDADSDNPWVSEGIPDTTFDDVIGMEDVKKTIRSRVIDQIKYPELYEQFGLSGGTGILLFGLPGTGKTTIARAIAHEVNAPMYVVKLSDVMNKWVGESEKRIHSLFEKARSTPVSLIFLDDFDALGGERSDDNGVNNKIIVELITQMDGFQKNTNTIVLLAATNNPWIIDSAIMRRFEYHIYVPLANHDARIAMLKKQLKNIPTAADIDYDALSEMIKGYNGADIVAVIKNAKTAALERTKEAQRSGSDTISPVTYDDLVNAARQHKTSVNPKDVVRLREYAAGRGIALPEEL